MKGVIFPVRVLIADDQPGFRMYLKRVLESRPEFRVVAVARDGREAVEYAHTLDPDVVLLDVDMPEMGLVEGVRQLRGVCPDTVVIVTSFRPDHLARRAFDAGAAGYIYKSEIDRDLFETIRLALWRQSLASPHYPNLEKQPAPKKAGRGTNGKPPVPQVVRSVGLAPTLRQSRGA